MDGKQSYQVWIGYYNLGQGHYPQSKPELVAEILADCFQTACIIYEHQISIKFLNKRALNSCKDVHYGKWYYNPESNSNSWTGKYYCSHEDALKSFENRK